jgi:SOS-response transcriptional repressor LexA
MTTLTIGTPPTARQLRVLRFIAEFIDTHGYSPTVREIGKRFGFTTNGVACHLSALRKRGCITWVDGSPRTLRVLVEVPDA